MTMKLRIRVVIVNQLWPWKNLKEKKKLRILKKMLSSWKGLLTLTNVNKEWVKTIITIISISVKLLIYKALKLFADLQGPICYKNPQLKGQIS